MAGFFLNEEGCMRSRWLRYGIGLILSMQGAFAQERDLAGVLRNDKESVS